jgi:hypothetical protein
MDFFTALAYAAIPAIVLVNALIVRRMKITIRRDETDPN